MKTKITFLVIFFSFLSKAQEYPFIIKSNTTNRLGINIPFTSNAHINGNIIFAGQNTSVATGTRLWKTDGTNSGTQLLSDACNTSASKFIKLGANVLFFASDVANNYGYELWKTDGTTAGTSMVKNIYMGSTGSIMGGSPLVEFNGNVYFSANDFYNGTELWKSDGTESGTVMVKNIASEMSNSNPKSFCVVNNQMFFVCNDGNGEALWRTDGTEAGTQLVKVINATQPHNSFIKEMINYNGVLLFSANDGVNGGELWRSDGTANGTYMVKDIYPGNSGNPLALTLFNNKVVFRAYDAPASYRIWQTDGTESGTTFFANLNPHHPDSNWSMIVYNDKLFVNNSSNPELLPCVTAEGTVQQINLADNGYTATYFSNPFIYGNNLYLSSNTTGYGYELWKIDQNNNPSFVKDLNDTKINNTPNGSSATLLNKEINKFIFSARYMFDEWNQYFVLWSFTEGDFSSIYDTTGSSNSFNYILQNIHYNTYNVFNELLYSIFPMGTNPVSGNVNGKVWIDNSVNQKYVKRHYEITPETNANTSTGKVTLYFTQQDFDDFNSIETNTLKLPQNSTDNAGKSNLKIEKFSGISASSTGLPDTYPNDSITIDPEDSDIIWDDINSRWSVSFNVDGFSGFFIKTQSQGILSAEEFSKPSFKLYPNPVSETLNFSQNLKDITIYDLTGRTIKSFTGNRDKIDVSGLSNGNYILKGETESGERFNVKFVKR